MTPTEYRDEVSRLAKTDHAKALELVGRISDPWFRAQAYAHLARYAESSPLPFARKAAKCAAQCKDDYQRSAVRAWEIVALAERDYETQARRSLEEAVEIAKSVDPISSRAESLILLVQAAFAISSSDGEMVAEVLEVACVTEHWREKRARRDAKRMLTGEMPPRPFFW
ncbi:MAG: hypothetical protein ABI481_08220 [Pyrinomonadaceae bacterium]